MCMRAKSPMLLRIQANLFDNDVRTFSLETNDTSRNRLRRVIKANNDGNISS